MRGTATFLLVGGAIAAAWLAVTAYALSGAGEPWRAIDAEERKFVCAVSPQHC